MRIGQALFCRLSHESCVALKCFLIVVCAVASGTFVWRVSPAIGQGGHANQSFEVESKNGGMFGWGGSTTAGTPSLTRMS